MKQAVVAVDPSATEEPARPVETKEPARPVGTEEHARHKLKKSVSKTIQLAAGIFPKFSDLRFKDQWVEAPPVFGCQSGTSLESTMVIMCQPENVSTANHAEILYGSLSVVYVCGCVVCVVV